MICIPTQECYLYPLSGSSSPALQNTIMQNYWESCKIDCVGHFSRNDHWIFFPKRKMDYNICLLHKTFFSRTFGQQSRASYGADFNRTWDKVHVDQTVCFCCRAPGPCVAMPHAGTHESHEQDFIRLAGYVRHS